MTFDWSLLLLEKVPAISCLVLKHAERLAVELVGARLGDGGDDRGARVLIFRLEVRGEDPEFLDRELGEGIAAADVLADDAALLHVALEADAVDEDVDLRTAEALAVGVLADAAAGECLAKLAVWTTRMPGASVAKLRKLRLLCGRFSICCAVMLVATSEVLVSTRRRPVTTMALPARWSPAGRRLAALAAGAARSMSRLALWPTRTMTRWVTGAPPAPEKVTS